MLITLKFIILLLIVLLIWVISLRRVVPTNQVHIVQRSKTTISYGKDTKDHAGNTYYEFPSWIPYLGITKIVLPVSVFDLDISNYEAYDKGRLPFIVDIKAFFRIENSNLAASRVSSFIELQSQLLGILQGAVRSILANEELEKIMSERSVYGEKFTAEVKEQLSNWGVSTVKNIELMDIRDGINSQVIQNIMAKKKSQIEMESRIEVANNRKSAKEAEIRAQQDVDLQTEMATQQVGLKRAEVEKDIGIAQEKTQQEIKEQAKVTKQKEMAVIEVEQTQAAEIAKEASRINAEANLIVRQREAEANLIIKQKEAEGIKAEGEARAEAETAMQLAPVQAQIELAREIGSNQDYQQYLITIEQIKANQEVGIAQARNLSGADIKVIANTGDVTGGVTHAMEVLSPKGGLSIGGALEALANTEAGKKLVDKITNTNKD